MELPSKLKVEKFFEMSQFHHALGPFHLFLKLDPSIHPKFSQACGKLQLFYIPKFLCFKWNLSDPNQEL